LERFIAAVYAPHHQGFGVGASDRHYLYLRSIGDVEHVGEDLAGFDAEEVMPSCLWLVTGDADGENVDNAGNDLHSPAAPVEEHGVTTIKRDALHGADERRLDGYDGVRP
jgi:hypothetical protein